VSRPSFYPVVSPATPGSPNLHRFHLERVLARGLPELHDAIQAKAGRIHALQGSRVPLRGATTPAAIAWHRATGATPGAYNRRVRRWLEEMNARTLITPTSPGWKPWGSFPGESG
jgi:hypothetical protein